MSSGLEDRFQTLHEIVRAAKHRLPAGEWDYLTGGTETEGGEAVGWDHIKGRVKQMIEEENTAAPLLDEDIAARLSAEGYERVLILREADIDAA